MSTRRNLIIALALIVLVMVSCNFSTSVINRQTVNGNGNLKTESRSVSGFDQVSLSGMGDVYITQGSEEKLSIEAEENLLPYITTEVVGSELRIGFKNNVNVIPHKGIRFDLTLKNLKSLAVSGAANVNSDALKSDSLNLNVSGAGKVTFKGLALNSLDVNSSGAGAFSLAGTATQQNVTISGTGNYDARDLKSTTASMTVSGAGNSTLWVTDRLNVHISGLGKVDYYGSPSVTQEISGAGKVNSLGNKE